MPIKVVKFYTREDLKNNPNHLFIFGDNYAREGYGGQAASARGESNAVGICTKKAPTYNPKDFFTDTEYADNAASIFADFLPSIRHLDKGGVVVWPMDGIGTGIANLQENAPLTLAFIETIIACLKSKYGVI